MEELRKKLMEELKNKLGEGYEVSPVDVNKNNGTILHGISILLKGNIGGPTVYVDNFYQRFQGTNEEIVEARVYLNKNDPDDSYVANAFAQKYREDSEIGQKYVELAETAAVGRALSDAGFGLQFADREKEMDPEVTEAPIDRSVMEGEPLIPGDFSETTDPEMEADFPEESIPGQCDIGDYIPMPGEVLERSKEENKTPVREVRKATKETSTSLEERFLQQNATPESVQGISKNMPVAEIYGKLNRDLAVRVVVSAGCYKGKTLGQIAVEKPGALQWYVDSYKGPDNLLRAAAKYLLDQALAPAC